VRVEVDDRQSRNAFAESADDRRSNGVVSSQANGTQSLIQKLADLRFDNAEVILRSKLQIAGIFINAFGAKLDPGFRP
jgi:hypothetical protein